jgi:hypothetical protein
VEDPVLGRWGGRLLALAEEYDGWRREFEADARECMDEQVMNR